MDACRACGYKPLHKLGCPVLTKVAATVTVFFGAVTAALVVWAVLGGPVGNIALGLVLTAFFAGYWYASSRRAAARGS